MLHTNTCVIHYTHDYTPAGCVIVCVIRITHTQVCNGHLCNGVCNPKLGLAVCNGVCNAKACVLEMTSSKACGSTSNAPKCGSRHVAPGPQRSRAVPTLADACQHLQEPLRSAPLTMAPDSLTFTSLCLAQAPQKHLNIRSAAGPCRPLR